MQAEQTLPSKDLIAQLKWRYATKKFDSNKKIDQVTWQKIEESLVLSPSSFGLQPWKFVVVTDAKIRQDLLSSTWGQEQVVDCSHLVVLCRKENMTVEHVERYVANIAETRNVPLDSLSGYRKMMVDFISATGFDANSWMSHQVYIALGNLMTAAAVLGIDSCPMEGFNKAAYDKALALPEKDCRSIVLCALGYRAADDKHAQLAKVRFPAEELFVKI